MWQVYYSPRTLGDACGYQIDENVMSLFLPVIAHRDYVAPLPSDHRFPMSKFARLVDVLIADGLVREEVLLRPGLVSRRVLGLVHDAGYVEAVLSQTLEPAAERRIGVPVSAAMAMRSRRAVAGTILTARAALKNGIACNTAGGSHHAFPGHGAGYCIFNDVAVAARLMQREGLVRRVLVVDLDVHQGDGTAAALAGDDSVFTFSMHCAVNFPACKQLSDLDVVLEPETGDDAYLALLEQHLPPLFEKLTPNLVIYVAGVDTHGGDRLGKLALTDDGLKARERLVLATCAARQVPVATVLGGGYSDDVDVLARRHAYVFGAAAEMQSAGEFGWARTTP